MDQPAWFIESLSWFLPMYDQVIFMTKAKAIIGDGKKIGGNRSGRTSKTPRIR